MTITRSYPRNGSITYIISDPYRDATQEYEFNKPNLLSQR